MNNTMIGCARFDATELDAVSRRALEEEIGETDESRTRSLQTLRNMVKEMEAIEPCLEEDFLIGFLRVAKFDCMKTFERIKLYYQYQEKYFDYFNKCFLSTSRFPNLHHVSAAPYRLPNNSVLLVALGGVDYLKISFAERFYLELLAAIPLFMNPVNQLAGFSLIIDYFGFEFRSLLAHTPTIFYFLVTLLQNVLPGRLKALHIVNVAPMLSGVRKMVLPILSKENKSRFFIHSNDGWKGLHASIPPKFLPEQYGGYLKQSDMIDLLTNLEELEETFLEQFKFGCMNTKHRRESIIKALEQRKRDNNKKH